jgi:hypothetical protein
MKKRIRNRMKSDMGKDEFAEQLDQFLLRQSSIILMLISNKESNNNKNVIRITKDDGIMASIR